MSATTVEVRIIDERLGQGIANLDVRLWGSVTTPLHTRRSFRGDFETDDQGRFRADIPSWSHPGSMAMLLARDARRDIVFYGAVPVDHQMLAVAAAEQVLSGSIDAHSLLPQIESRPQVQVVAHFGARSGRPGYFIGRTSLGPAGDFTISTRLGLDPMDPIQLSFSATWFEDVGPHQMFLLDEVPAEDLLAVEPVPVARESHRVHLELVPPESGTALESSVLEVRASGRFEGRGIELRFPGAKADLRLSPGRYGGLVSTEGYPSAFVDFDVPARRDYRVPVPGRRHDDSSDVAGRVTTWDRVPVEHAVVHAIAIQEGRPLGDPVIVRSDADGLFAIDVSHLPTRFRVAAFHKEFGHSRPHLVQGPSSEPIALKFPDAGSISINLIGIPGLPGTSGQTEYIAVPQGSGVATSGRGWPPLLLRLPSGRYAIFFRVPGSELYGAATFEVRPGELGVYDAWLQPAGRQTVTLVDDDRVPIEGAEVRLEHPAWPDIVSQRWGSARTGTTGKAVIFHGDLNGGTFRIANASRTWSIARTHHSEQLIQLPH